MVHKETDQRLTGKLISVSHTRLGISFAISLTSQFMHCPGEVHLYTANRIMQCLEGTLEAYTNADYARSVTDIFLDEIK